MLDDTYKNFVYHLIHDDELGDCFFYIEIIQIATKLTKSKISKKTIIIFLKRFSFLVILSYLLP